MVTITYEALRKIQSDERESAALSQLPPDFYAGVRSMVRERKEKLARNFSLADAREFENTLKVLKDIYALREQKLLLRALLVSGGGRDGSPLSPEERWAFDEVVKVLEKGKKWFDSTLEGEEVSLPNLEKEAQNHGHHAHASKHEEKVKLKFLTTMPEFVGADGAKYGPYDAGVEAEMPAGEATFLLKRKAAEKA
jgi:DNA replication initiation complex subunit (GINS family)